MEKRKKYLIVVAGPTASGKTATAIALARHWDSCILSADSRQFYKEMNIGTAKPSAEELAAAPHYFVGNISITEEYSAGDYEREAIALLEALYQERDVVLMAGGSGLFIRAVLQGLDKFPEVPESVRAQWSDRYAEKGLEYLQQRLAEEDPAYYERVDLQNPHRLIRALSVISASGKPFSSFRRGKPKQRPFTALPIYLDWPREQLYQRINRRVDKMLEAGLLEEARALYPRRQLQALQTVGYQELFDYFDGKIPLEEAVRLIKRNSRRYAKRQLTWLRKMPEAQPFHPEDIAAIREYLDKAMIR